MEGTRRRISILMLAAFIAVSTGPLAFAEGDAKSGDSAEAPAEPKRDVASTTSSEGKADPADERATAAQESAPERMYRGRQ